MAKKPDTPCSVCGRLLWRGRGSLAAPTCRTCRAAAIAAARPDRPPSQLPGYTKPEFLVCGMCGLQFKRAGRRHHRVNFCSHSCHIQWQRTDPRYVDNRRTVGARYRARKRGAVVEVFSRSAVLERDGWVCQLCMEPIDRAAGFPDVRSAAIDHIVPLSLGGQHSLANTQASHFGCNASKGARLTTA